MASNITQTPVGREAAAFFGEMKRAAENDRRVVYAGALVLAREIKLELSHPGTGRQYGKHRASAPGEPPAVDTGVLRNTIGVEVLEQEHKMRVGSGQQYAPYLEFGSGLARIAPRPFMRTAFARAKKQMASITTSGLKNTTRKRV